MAKKPQSYAEARDEIWGKDPHYRGFFETLEELNKETDRGVALVTTSFLDRLLGDSLAAFMLENDGARAMLSGFNAPLGTLNTKIAACHALGLITDDEVRQCNIIRKIRNEFAHEIQVTFASGRLKDLCDNLDIPKSDKDVDARAKFAKASLLLLVALINRPHQVAEKRLQCGDWVTAKSIRAKRRGEPAG
jgi:mannitol operon repressor